jgi:hypothetical protein
MKYIAHRGLTNGPDKNFENLPSNIDIALKLGYDVEIDVRYIDGKWMLGHDTPDHQVSYEFLERPGIWIHAKNLDALYVLGADNKLNFFWHQEDEFTLTSQGYIWTFPGKTLTENSVMVMPEYIDPTLDNTIGVKCFAICSDYVEQIKSR